MILKNHLDYEYSPFFLRDSRASEKSERENHPTLTAASRLSRVG